MASAAAVGWAWGAAVGAGADVGLAVDPQATAPTRTKIKQKAITVRRIGLLPGICVTPYEIVNTEFHLCSKSDFLK